MKSQKEWRRLALAERDHLPAAEVAANSAAITERLFQVGGFRQCRSVMFYASFRSEVRTWEAMARSLELGMRVALPLTLPASRGLQPRLITDPHRQLRPGYCAIPEPDPEQTEIVSPRELEVVIVPGSAFDLQGGRVGYGGGFYDRFLQREAPQALRIGLAFAVQLRSTPLPLADHDQRLDMLVSEAGVYEFSQR